MIPETGGVSRFELVGQIAASALQRYLYGRPWWVTSEYVTAVRRSSRKFRRSPDCKIRSAGGLRSLELSRRFNPVRRVHGSAGWNQFPEWRNLQRPAPLYTYVP